ncbi:MAG TPA: hypothetical protein VGM27_20750 [Acidobacteriaceae bacterium]
MLLRLAKPGVRVVILQSWSQILKRRGRVYNPTSFLARHSTRIATVLLVAMLSAGCSRGNRASVQAPSLSGADRTYLRLAVALGERDPDSLDYYYGPDEWVSDIRKDPPPLTDIRQSARGLAKRLEAASLASPQDQARRAFLIHQLGAIASRADLLLGAPSSFDRETDEFFGIRVPPQPDQHRLAEVRAELNDLLPGKGDLAQRYLLFEKGFIVSRKRLPVVMETALRGCRQRTLAQIAMPAGENVTLRYVHNKSWSGFSRYLGNFQSLIDINTDFALTVDRALQLACHEGYPGHHVYNSLRDARLVRGEHMTELMVQPTFSPQSLASEAAATFAVEIAFPQPARADFERESLFALAGIDPRKADKYCRIERLVDELHAAEPAIARDYLDGRLEFVRAGAALEKQALMAQSDATLKYINEYRSYMITYTVGRDLVSEAVDQSPRTTAPEALRWHRYLELMNSVAPLPVLARANLEASTRTSSRSPIGGQLAAREPGSAAKRL